MNRAERRAAFKAAEEHPHQQKCQCGWLLPREVFVERLGAGEPPARVRIVIICPVCEMRGEVEVGLSALA
jgi:hypothetical protein